MSCRGAGAGVTGLGIKIWGLMHLPYFGCQLTDAVRFRLGAVAACISFVCHRIPGPRWPDALPLLAVASRNCEKKGP